MPRTPRPRLWVKRALVSLLVAASVVSAVPGSAAASSDLPGVGFSLWEVGPSEAWALVDSGYTLSEVDPLSGANMGVGVADGLSADAALQAGMMDAGLLALDATRLAEAARLEALARQQRQGTGKLRPGAVPEQYAALVEAAAASCPGLPVEILAAQIEAESNWNPRAVSPVGAKGLGQFMPATWASFGQGDPFDPAASIAAAARYDCYLLEQTRNIPGDPLSNMLAAYNAGPSRVQQYQGIPPFAETQNYVRKILARAPELLDDGTDSTAVSDPSLDGYANGRIPASALCSIGIGSHRLRCDAASAFKRLNEGYRAAFGSNICITDSYRSYEAQVSLKAAKPTLAAKPGTSNHGWGMATDLCGGINSFGTSQHRWMAQNAGRYGWVLPSWAQAGGSKPEPWHWEFGRIS